MESNSPLSGGPFNNADSFAQAFDAAWTDHSRAHPDAGLPAEEKLGQVLAEIADHPFLLANPALAHQVADFRIRLLGL